MKHLSLLLTAVLVMAITGCKKEVPISDALAGTWELRQDGGGWTPIVNHKAGNDTLAVFTATHYSLYARGKLTQSGTYTVKRDSSYLYGRVANRIIFDGRTDNTKQFFEIHNNQLGLWIDADDAGSSTYQRIK